MSDNKELQMPINWTVLKEQASMLLKSGFLPQAIRTPEQVIAIVLTGKELGIGMMEALRGINVIQGKPSVSPQTMLALANRTGELENIKIETSHEGALVEITRKGKTPHTERFGPQEAVALGLMTKDNYTKQPATMFKWRALAAALRVTFPDAISGLYTPEEMGAEVTIDEQEEMKIVPQERLEAQETTGKTSFRDDSRHMPSENVSHEITPKTEPQAPKKTSDSEFSHYFSKMIDLASPICNGDLVKAEAMILEASAFANDKGKIIKARSFNHLMKSEKWLKSTYGKLKDQYQAWMKNQPIDSPVDEPEPTIQEEKIPF